MPARGGVVVRWCSVVVGGGGGSGGGLGQRAGPRASLLLWGAGGGLPRNLSQALLTKIV